MPIYEFYCADCHRVYSFFSRTIDTTKRPSCPQCGRPKLERRMSRFAISGRREETAEGQDPMPDVDEAKMEQVMEELARESEGMDEDDPRQMGRMMRKLYDSSGLQLGGRMEEAIRRLEAGEDPEGLEEEFGDLLEGEEPMLGEGGGRLRGMARRLRPPEVDETIYDL